MVILTVKHQEPVRGECYLFKPVITDTLHKSFEILVKHPIYENNWTCFKLSSSSEQTSSTLRLYIDYTQNILQAFFLLEAYIGKPSKLKTIRLAWPTV